VASGPQRIAAVIGFLFVLIPGVIFHEDPAMPGDSYAAVVRVGGGAILIIGATSLVLTLERTLLMPAGNRAFAAL